MFTDSSFDLVQAEEQHRDHAIVEQVFADWNDGRLAHLPYVLPGQMPPGWPAPPSPATCCAPPDPWPAPPTARPAAPPIRRDLIDIAARTARHGRGHTTLHRPEA